MEYVGGTNQYLMTIHSLEHSGRVTVTARRVLQCFRVVDVGYFVTGLALTVSSVDADIQNVDTILFGSILLVFSFLSAICNALALIGVNKEIRRYLLPWLILYPWVIVLLVVAVIHTLWVTDFHLELYQIFILIVVCALFTCWKHVYRMYVLLGSPQLDEDIDHERLMNYGSMGSSEQEDLPPKYEDIEEDPPQYNEATMTHPGIIFNSRPPSYCSYSNRYSDIANSYYDNKSFKL